MAIGDSAGNCNDGAAQIRARMAMLPLDEGDPPALAEGKAANQFYGKLMDGAEAVVVDVDGMSGGPIYAQHRIDDKWKYKAIGAQSAWYRVDRIVALCPIAPFETADANASYGEPQE